MSNYVKVFEVSLKGISHGYITKEDGKFKPWYNGCGIGGSGTFEDSLTILRDFLYERLRKVHSNAIQEIKDCEEMLELFNNDEWINYKIENEKL